MLSDKKLKELKKKYPCKNCGNVSRRHEPSCSGIDFEQAYIDLGKELEIIGSHIVPSRGGIYIQDPDYKPKFIAFRFNCRNVEDGGGFTIPAKDIIVESVNITACSIRLNFVFKCVCLQYHNAEINLNREL